jgi:hypothetical protein
MGQQVGRAGQIMVAVRQTEASPPPGRQTRHPHQLADPLPTTGLAVFLKPNADAGAAVGLPTFPVGFA